MNLRIAKPSQRPQKRNLVHRFFSALTILATMFGTLGSAAMAPVVAAPAAAPTTVLEISVVDATDASPIPDYKFLINEDNTGDPTQPRTPDCDPTVEASLADCDWPSIRAVPGAAPIVTQGDQSILSAATGLDLGPYLAANPTATKFLISVVADGYKIGGKHFTIDRLDTDTPVVVELVPDPLPLATMRIQVFEDNQSPNGQMDAPVELGLNGFEGRISDVLGEISTDWYGNPLCTEYDTNGDPIPGTGGICLSGDTNHDGVINGSDNPADRGLVVIPNIGSGRYAALVVPPNGTDWVQTTTLEGGHDWDTWLQEGATGYDTEFIFAGEPFPWTMFGFVRPKALSVSGPYKITGTVVGISVYIPPQGGAPIPGGEWGGLSGAKIKGPIERPYIALSNLNTGDQMVYMQRANADGTFSINNVPNGSYLLTAWDGPQSYLIDFYNVTVNNGDVNMGNVFLTGWFANFHGSVFIDTNADGIRQSTEKGLAGQWVSLRSRGNNVVQHGSTGATTDANGYYDIKNGYPFTAWQIMEVYNDRYHTTGITYQTDNGPETTVLGAGVDVNILPIIGLSGRLDWGVLPYARGENGGIVGTVTYDVTRNELDPRLAAAEDWQPSIPDQIVNLYQAVRNPDGTFATAPDGSYLKSTLINSAITETWERPSDCEALDVDGNLVIQQALAILGSGGGCVESPIMGIQFGPLSDGTNFGASVNGNYGFGDGCFDNLATKDSGVYDPNTGDCTSGTLETLPAGDYLVEVVSPDDLITGNPLFKVTREEDINVFNGDEYTSLLPPPPCAGALHTVDVAGVGADGPDATDNPNFAAEGGSPFEGQQKPLCDVKLVRLQDSRSIAPTFNFFTDVPLPGRFLGYIVDDLNLSTDPRTTLFGEKAGLASAPVGVYDFADRLVTTLQSDPNGLWEVLLPSTLQINCPTPSGVCSNMYRFVGNDPGQPPDRLNPNHNPQYRTITANFEVWPGVSNPADLAPTQIAVSIQSPGSQFNALSQCALDAATPKFFAVDRPNVPATGTTADRTITIFGDAFGAFGANSRVTLDGMAVPVTPASNWTNGAITVTMPSGFATGPHQLMVRANNGQTTVNGLTFHVTGAGYNPTVLTVNPNLAASAINFHTLQAALTAAAATPTDTLVAVYPGLTALYNPHGIYFENVVISSPVKLQGVGPGGQRADGSYVNGVVIDGVGFTNDNPASEDWRVLVGSIGQVGNPNVAEGEVIYVIARTTTQFGSAYRAAIDGLTIQGGDQTGFPNNINFVGGGQTSIATAISTLTGGAVTNVTVTSGGNGYTTPPPVTFVGGGGTGATADANLTNVVASVTVTNGGAGYTTPPTVIFVGGGGTGATATATLTEENAVNDIIVTNGGSGYTSLPTVIFVGGGGTGATADAALDTVVGSVTVTNGGSGYTTPPTVTIAPPPAPGPAGQGFIETQGGGIFVNGYARFLQITNNILKSNGGAYTGAIRLGTPDIGDNENDSIRIANNRIIANGGTNLAGAIGLFTGADNYEIDHNDLCGNFSAEYGGAISHYGLSANGAIHDNRIYFNQSYDEGGGIMIVGELPVFPATVSTGTGPVSVYNNLIQSNLGNDDGGGVRVLNANADAISIYNNFIVNNISTDEGGGIALDTATNVVVMNNTIMKNITTATAATSSGTAKPAGLTVANGPTPALPVLFNNIFWDNRAGSWNGVTVDGIGTLAAPAVNLWDMGVIGSASLLSPTNSLLQQNNTTTDGAFSATNKYAQNPLVITQYDTSVAVYPWRTNPNMVQAAIIALDLPVNLLGNYHLQATSPARNMGAALKGATPAPVTDIDDELRPASTAWDAGADEQGAAFPAGTPVLDNFNRTTPLVSGSIAIGGNWRGYNCNAATSCTNNTGFFRILSGEAQVINGGFMYRSAGAAFGARQEAYLTFTKVVPTATEHDLLLKVNNFPTGGSLPGATARAIEVVYDPSASVVRIETLTPGGVWTLKATFTGITFQTGDTFGARALQNGTVGVYKNGVLIGSTNITGGAWTAAFNNAGGRIGVWFMAPSFTIPNDARFDNFGGGTLP